MKVLLFTHEQDIDGMGSVVLAKQVFEDLDYIPCKTFAITDNVRKTILDGSIYNYDKIYVTDLCIKEPLLSQIALDPILNQKLIILDHHKSEIVEGNDKYPFVNIIVENEKGKVSGTSLFYDYLVENRLLKPTPCIQEFVEMTRQYDTWEWKTIYNNPKARMLHLLFEQVGYERYLKLLDNIIKNPDTFEFGPEEMEIIMDFDKKYEEDKKIILSDMKIVSLNIENQDYRIGFVKTPYKYRNELNEEVDKDGKYELDLVGMIMTDIDTVSYRCVRNVDASKVGAYFGGKGHVNAASNPQNNEKFTKVLSLFDKNNK